MAASADPLRVTELSVYSRSPGGLMRIRIILAIAFAGLPDSAVNGDGLQDFDVGRLKGHAIWLSEISFEEGKRAKTWRN
jgi:hypothetical protein